MMEKWEYYTTFIEAKMEQLADYEKDSLPQSDDKLPKYSPYATMPELNRFGEKGWELVSMTPVYIGRNHDILTLDGQGGRTWSYTYFCVFKRRI